MRDRLVGHRDMQRIGVGLGIDRDGARCPSACAVRDDAAGDLAAIGDQDLVNMLTRSCAVRARNPSRGLRFSRKARDALPALGRRRGSRRSRRAVSSITRCRRSAALATCAHQFAWLRALAARTVLRRSAATMSSTSRHQVRSAGTTSCTRPMRCASAASKRSAVRK